MISGVTFASAWLFPRLTEAVGNPDNNKYSTLINILHDVVKSPLLDVTRIKLPLINMLNGEDGSLKRFLGPNLTLNVMKHFGLDTMALSRSWERKDEKQEGQIYKRQLEN